MPNTTKRCALIIEDDTDDRQAICDHLLADGSHQYEILEAASGLQGIEALETRRPDVVILDQQDGRGTDVLRELRQRGHTAVPVVFLTDAPSCGAEVLDPLAIGADDYLDKHDVSSVHLRRAISNAVTKAELRARLEGTGPISGEARGKMTERAKREARLLGIVCHDLRTPLGAIAAGIEVLACEQPLSDRGRDVLDRLARSTANLQQIVDRALDAAEVRQAGRFAIVRQRCNLHELVEERIIELRASHPGREIVYAPRGASHGDFDPTALGQLVANLIGNALKYGASGEAVRVAVAGEADAVTISVTNHGEPIPAGLRKTLFDPFTRDAAAPQGGLGLGLYIAKEIATAHGADISFVSDQRATTFTVVVPRAVARQSSQATCSAS